jgi:hypothetical protein
VTGLKSACERRASQGEALCLEIENNFIRCLVTFCAYAPTEQTGHRLARPAVLVDWVNLDRFPKSQQSAKLPRFNGLVGNNEASPARTAQPEWYFTTK